MATLPYAKEVGMSAKGSSTVGYACSYVPVEIVMAAGFTPQRVMPIGRCAEADGYIHPNTCFYVKSLLADALSGAFADMSAVILANSCDGMRKLFDLWEAYVKHPVALFMDIPKKRQDDSAALFAAELKRLATNLSRIPGGKPLTNEGLNEAARQVNELRLACINLFDAQKTPKCGIRGSDVFSLLREGSMLEPAEFKDKVAGFVQAHSGKHSAGNGRRILVTGNILNNPDLVLMIERAGGSVAGLDTCFGRRHYEMLVEEGTPDPYEALARRYLLRPPCARMMGIAGQIDELKKAVEDTRADGVVLSKVKFCDNLTYNIPLLQEAVAAAGARCLVLENDYEWSDVEKARIKVEAFLEMLAL
jgi:benzoyl-CoA reductase/2-hydroxyglutaryl-CoA dehydratase subunit BcrC/BadD/HgdB